jgi:D-serine deaminase-like pyridoxal phosphate-dependent protein
MNEPTTRAGKLLLDDGIRDLVLTIRVAAKVPDYEEVPHATRDVFAKAIRDIEDEAHALGALHEHLAAEGEIERAIAKARADALAEAAEKVRALPGYQVMRPGGDFTEDYYVMRAAVLAILEGTDR